MIFRYLAILCVVPLCVWLCGAMGIKQEYKPVEKQPQQITVSADTINVTSGGGKSAVKISAVTPWKLDITDKWISSGINSCEGTCQVVIAVEESMVNHLRIGKVKVISKGFPVKTITVIQKARHEE